MHETASYAAYRKSPHRSIKHSTYFETYDELFGRYRGKPITFVEIGVLGGGSLFMWREFFGPEARIVGIDLNPNARKWEAQGFEIHIGSQSDERFWREVIGVVGPMDVVLDDGGHTFEQQIVTTEALIDNIADGGMLVVEDTHTSYMAGFGTRKYSFMKYATRMMDRINHRFHQLRGSAEKRVWSVQVFESIVAFHVNRAASHRVSELTDNGGAHDQAEDYRYADGGLAGKLARLYDESAVFKALPDVRPAVKAALDTAGSVRLAGKIKRYFR